MDDYPPSLGSYCNPVSTRVAKVSKERHIDSCSADCNALANHEKDG